MGCFVLLYLCCGKETANNIKGALTMKSKKTELTAVLTLALALNIVTVSAAAASENVK